MTTRLVIIAVISHDIAAHNSKLDRATEHAELSTNELLSCMTPAPASAPGSALHHLTALTALVCVLLLDRAILQKLDM